MPPTYACPHTHTQTSQKRYATPTFSKLGGINLSSSIINSTVDNSNSWLTGNLYGANFHGTPSQQHMQVAKTGLP